jgi:hypothetical protein
MLLLLLALPVGQITDTFLLVPLSRIQSIFSHVKWNCRWRSTVSTTSKAESVAFIFSFNSIFLYHFTRIIHQIPVEHFYAIQHQAWICSIMKSTDWELFRCFWPFAQDGAESLILSFYDRHLVTVIQASSILLLTDHWLSTTALLRTARKSFQGTGIRRQRGTLAGK